MKKLFILFLSILPLSAFAQNADKARLPEWFMKPAEHMYVGICEPNGDVQQAINVALLHYLMCHDLSGKIKRTNLVAVGNEGMETNMQNMLKLDTTVQYSIEEIVSTPKGEYICRISDRPTLSRRILLTYIMNYHSVQNDGNEKTEMEEAFQSYYNDGTGKSGMNYTRKLDVNSDGSVKYTYSSQYVHENGVTKEYSNDKAKTSFGEQLITQYMYQLEAGFFAEKTNSSDNSDAASKAYHQSMPIAGFEYSLSGEISIIP